MRVPSGWNVKQSFLDLYATLNDAASRELSRIPSFVNVDEQNQEKLGEFWTHLHASAYLIMCFSIAEGKWGRRFWENDLVSNRDKEEFRILYLVRNSLVHTGGDVSKVKLYKHTNGNISRSLSKDVGPFLERAILKQGGVGPMVGINTQSHLKYANNKVTLTQSSFERIKYLFENIATLLFE